MIDQIDLNIGDKRRKQMKLLNISTITKKIAYWLDHQLSVYWMARYRQINQGLNMIPEDTLLDVGCGYGRWSKFFSDRTCFSCAIDIDETGLHHVKTVNDKICVLNASASDLPVRDNSFSRIISIDVIEHVPDDKSMVVEFNRVLKPGGRVVLTTLLQDRPHYIRRMEFHDHVREYNAKELTNLFDQADMHIEKVFYFYYAPRMIAREIQALIEQVPNGDTLLKRGVIVSGRVAVALLCKLLGSLDEIVSLGKPGGIGIIASKKLSL
jgi:ubiquinone/menaquinone biosynthesis C-methylase UbiE